MSFSISSWSPSERPSSIANCEAIVSSPTIDFSEPAWSMKMRSMPCEASNPASCSSVTSTSWATNQGL